jgi:nucleoside transporter
MVAGFAVELGMRAVSPAPLWLAAAGSAVLGIYSLVALPHTPPSGRGRSLGDALGLPAFALFRDRSFAALIACGVALAVLQQFYNVFANPFLRDLEVPRPALVMTVAQVSEVLCMLSFPFAVARWGLRGMMLIGLVGWALRNGVFATGSVAAVVALGLPLHGVAYSYFFIVLALYVDRVAPPHLRASAQGMLTFLVVGIGSWAGNALSGAVVEAQRFGDAVTWGKVWLVPTVGSVVVTAAFLALVRPPRSPQLPDGDPHAPQGQPEGEP